MKGNLSERPNSKESAEYFELLRFPTVGADPEHLRDCVQCAMWLKKWLEEIGAKAVDKRMGRSQELCEVH